MLRCFKLEIFFKDPMFGSGFRRPLNPDLVLNTEKKYPTCLSWIWSGAVTARLKSGCFSWNCPPIVIPACHIQPTS